MVHEPIISNGRWRIRYADENGQRREKTLHADKAASQAEADRLLAEIEARRTGEISRAQIMADVPNSTHLDDYGTYLHSRRSQPKHQRVMMTRLRRVMDGCNMKFPRDLDADKVLAFVNDLRDSKDHGTHGEQGIAGGTAMQYLNTVRRFGKWLDRDGRVDRDPFRHLEQVRPDAEPRRQRRVLTDEEIKLLLDSILATGEEYRGLSARDRWWLYRVTLACGFRCGEVSALHPEHFLLENDLATILLRGKSRKPNGGKSSRFPPISCPN